MKTNIAVQQKYVEVVQIFISWFSKSTGNTQEAVAPSQHDWKIVYRGVKNQSTNQSFLIKALSRNVEKELKLYCCSIIIPLDSYLRMNILW